MMDNFRAVLKVNLRNAKCEATVGRQNQHEIHATKLSYRSHTKSHFVKCSGRYNRGIKTGTPKNGHNHTVMHSVDALSVEPHKSISGARD
jgi:hypothetical protein